MELPKTHNHVSERESAHTWPDGQADDAKWEDCLWASAIEWVRLTHDDSIPPTLAEAELLRDASGEPPTGGSSADDVARGLRVRYGLTKATIGGFSNLWSNLNVGVAALAVGSMGAFPAGHRLRRWYPSFNGGHGVLVIRLDEQDRVWWCDPLAPDTGYNGEWAAKAELAAYVNHMPGRHIVGPLRESIMQPLPVSDAKAYTLTVRADAQLYLPDMTPKVKMSAAAKVLSPFGATVNGVSHRAVIVTTGGVTQLLLVQTSDCSNMVAVVSTGYTQAQVDTMVAAAKSAERDRLATIEAARIRAL